jgi:hypothetical protein
MHNEDSIASGITVPSLGGLAPDAQSVTCATQALGKQTSETLATISASCAKPVIDQKKRRSLDSIANELNSVLKREAVDVIKIGGLLTEAKAQLSHGQWLAWLAEHFPLSKSTVSNYINAYKFVVQFPTVGNLKIHVSALYLLASSAFDANDAAVILKVAETEWVDWATVLHLPAVNTPQFEWALNKTKKKAQPIAPIFEPEVAARAIYLAATHRRRELWLRNSTVQAILGNRIARACSTAFSPAKAITDSSSWRAQKTTTAVSILQILALTCETFCPCGELCSHLTVS